VSAKLKEVIVLLDKEKAKVRKLEEEVKRLKDMLVLSLIDQEWQYLTDDEIKEIVSGVRIYEGDIGGYTRELFDKIEAKIREKNECTI
jgi:hypothetical protein